MAGLENESPDALSPRERRVQGDRRSEDQRAQAEGARQDAEVDRQRAEEGRQDEEWSRRAAERARVSEEELRHIAESARQAAEDARCTAEAARAESQHLREKLTTELEDLKKAVRDLTEKIDKRT
jgi:membrane protein involved in colicin uptake